MLVNSQLTLIFIFEGLTVLVTKLLKTYHKKKKKLTYKLKHLT